MSRSTTSLGLLLAGMTQIAAAQESVHDSVLDLSVAYAGDLRRNTTGGLEVGNAYSSAFDLGLNWATTAFGTRVQSSLAVMYMGGDEITGELVGDLQGINNIEAAAGWRLYESWFEIGFGDSESSVRAGILDLNAEFDTPVTQGLFTASPFGIGTELSQTGVRGPVVWPVTGFGIRAAGAIDESFRWRLGAYDGAPGSDDDDFTSLHVSSSEGALLIGEVEYSSDRIHKLSVGSWMYTAPFERIDAALQPSAAPEHGNHGFYTLVDLSLGTAGDVSFDGALRAGTAPAKFNAVDRYAGFAVTAQNLWKSRPGDSLGLGIAWAHAGDPFRDISAFEGAPATTAETVVELVYRTELTPWLVLLPNVQFIDDPGASHGVGDSWVAGLRFEMSHERTWQLSARRDAPADDSYARSQPQGF